MRFVAGAIRMIFLPMTIAFTSKLFGLEDAEANVQFGVGADTSGQALPTWDPTTKKWKSFCNIGECGMTPNIIGDKYATEKHRDLF